MPLVFFTFSRVPRLHSASTLDQYFPPQTPSALLPPGPVSDPPDPLQQGLALLYRLRSAGHWKTTYIGDPGVEEQISQALESGVAVLLQNQSSDELARRPCEY
eukprot:1196337-Prorocentrum_minimum.AAC.4